MTPFPRTSPRCSSLLALAGLAVLPALSALSTPAEGSAPGASQAESASSRLVTLWARDDLASSLDFRSGESARIEGGEVVLDRAQIVYGVFVEGQATIGFVDQELVELVHLGPLFVPPEVRGLDAAAKFPVSAFHTLFLDGGHIGYLDARGKAVRLPAAEDILGPMLSQGVRHFDPLVGHVYLLRFRQRGVDGTGLLVKLEVIDVEPRRSLTLRWGVLGEQP